MSDLMPYKITVTYKGKEILEYKSCSVKGCFKDGYKFYQIGRNKS